MKPVSPWFSILWGPSPDEPLSGWVGANELPRDPRQERIALKALRRDLEERIVTLRAYGYEDLARETDGSLRSVDRRLALLRRGPSQTLSSGESPP
jgi:hypothetical protein